MPTFKPEQLRADFSIFRKSLEEAHPGLYRYTQEKTFKARLDSVFFSLNRPHTEQEFYKSLKLLLTSIRSGKTTFTVPKRIDPKYPYGTDQLFPVQVYFSESRAYALNSFSDSIAVPPNAEILEINGRKMESLVKELMPFVAATDGFIPAGRYQELGTHFGGYLAAFGNAQPVYEITYRKSGQTKTVPVKAVNLEQVIKVLQRENAFQKLPGASLEFKDKKVAVLTMASFEEVKHLSDLEEFLEAAFAQIKASQVNTLVVDLRGNESGDDKYGALLYSYLTPKPFRFYRSITTNTNKRFSFMKYGQVPLSFFFYRRTLKMNPDSTFRYPYHPNLKPQEPKPNAFTGQVYVLQDSRTSGPAAEFAAVTSSNNRATLIGQETAGTFQGSTQGKTVQVKLPNSKFELTIPLWKVALEVNEKLNPGRGVQPQHVVAPISEDLLTGTDRALDFTIDLVRKKNETGESKSVD